MHPWMLGSSLAPLEAIGTIAVSCFESFRSSAVRGAPRPLTEHFLRKCICVSPAMVV